MSESDLLAALGGAAVSFEVKGLTLTARPLTVADAEAYRAHAKAHPDNKAAHVGKLLSLTVTGPGGAAFTESLVAKLPAQVVNEIAEKVTTLNGWGDAAGNS